MTLFMANFKESVSFVTRQVVPKDLGKNADLK